LDALNIEAGSFRRSSDDLQLQCSSICCGDTIDGAREIIEAPKIARWNAMRHFFMAFENKERAKQILNFSQVPFYIVFDRNGKLLYSGNKKMDWIALFQNVPVEDEIRPNLIPEVLISASDNISDTNKLMIDAFTPQDHLAPPVLVINDMDF
jgi:hypothetical protein